jgi:hypothetical protein
VITHDERIRYKANELAAVVQYKVAMLLVVGRACGVGRCTFAM